MYQFNIKQQEDGGYKFELDGIRMIVDDYSIKDGKHLFANPNKAIAYFLVNDNIYGISNDPMNLDTAEAFYDSIMKQYNMFNKNEQKGLKHSA